VAVKGLKEMWGAQLKKDYRSKKILDIVKKKIRKSHKRGRPTIMFEHLKPDFLIIGAQKAGTSSLAKYLSYHPYIIPANFKEVNFFYLDVNFNKGYDWYHDHFPLIDEVGKDVLAFEATPDYIYYPYCAERIYQYNPRIKLIVVLRNPIERAYSAWNMFRSRKERKIKLHHGEYRTFHDAIMDEMRIRKIKGSSYNMLEPSYLRRGLYFTQLQRYLKLFPISQIHIADYSVLKHNCRQFLGEIINFLGIPSYNCDISKLQKKVNVGHYVNKSIPDKMLNLLSDFYKPHNERLFKLLGKRFDWL
jgi:hypothetical protein